MNEFTIHLVSTDCMRILPENTFARYEIFLKAECHWRVPLSENKFPSRINQVNSPRNKKYSTEGIKNHERSIASGAVSKPYKRETVLINAVSYENLELLIKAIKTATVLTPFRKTTLFCSCSLAKLKELLFLTKKDQAFCALKDSKMAQALILAVK